MSEPSRPPVSPIGRALGRLPSGLYVLTVGSEDKATGMLASWVQQAGFDPPMVTAVVGRGRFVADLVAATGRFTLNQVAAGQKGLVRHFSRGFEPGEPAFEGLERLEPGEARGGPVLAEALAFLDVAVVGEMPSGDHRVFLGRVEGGRVLDPDAEPMLHVRQNGFHY